MAFSERRWGSSWSPGQWWQSQKAVERRAHRAGRGLLQSTCHFYGDRGDESSGCWIHWKGKCNSSHQKPSIGVQITCILRRKRVGHKKGPKTEKQTLMMDQTVALMKSHMVSMFYGCGVLLVNLQSVQFQTHQTPVQMNSKQTNFVLTPPKISTIPSDCLLFFFCSPS